MGDVDTSVQQSPRVNVKTSGRHISLSARREPARVQAFVVKSQVIESIAKEHDTTSQSHSASSGTGNGMLSISLHRGPGETPSALEKQERSQKQRRDPAPNTYVAASKQRCKVIHRSIHNPGYYLQWLL